MTFTKYYDLIVIGGDLSAYLAATLASVRGLDTLLVDNMNTKYSYDWQNFKFDLIPQYSHGLYPEKLFDKIFSELDLSIEEQKDIRKTNATHQIISSKFRVKISDNFQELKKEIAREFPTLTTEIMDFYKFIKQNYELTEEFLDHNIMIPPETLKEKLLLRKTLRNQRFNSLTKFKSLADLLNHFKLKNTDFETFIKIQIQLFSYTHKKEPSFFQAIRIIGSMFKRTCYIDGGYQKLIELLLRKFQQAGGRIKKNLQVDKLIYDRKKLIGIHTTNPKKIYNARFILSSTNINDLTNLYGSKINRRYLRRTKTLLKQYDLYTINLGINEKVIPVGMNDRFVFLVNENKPYNRENLILCNITHAKDNIISPEGIRTLSASCLVPHHIMLHHKEELIKIKDRIIYNLKKIIPFLEEHIYVIYPPASNHYQHLNKFQEQDEEPVILSPSIYHKVGKQYLGITAISNRTCDKNLFFTGREVLPDLGFDGEMLSCYKIVTHIEQSAKQNQEKTIFS